MKYSRNQINKAGEVFLTASTETDRNEALEVINDWRGTHLHPLETLKKQLSKILAENEIEPVLISQRLKRLSSIEYKLDLNPQMRLGGMQDIGGFRAVFKDIDDLYSALDVVKDAFKSHKLEKVIDYIDEPKYSGYRSIHLVYRYKSKNSDYNGLRLELQLRTKLQHNWATAVETAGIYTRTSLKSSQGSDQWLEAFKIISSLFAIKEEKPVLKEHSSLSMEELMIICYEITQRLKIIPILSALRVTIGTLETNDTPDYYLLNINFIRRKVSISKYKKSQLEVATQNYMEQEKIAEENINAVVLVATESFKELQEAYPSYFLDTSEFIEALEKINLNCEKFGLVKK